MRWGVFGPRDLRARSSFDCVVMQIEVVSPEGAARLWLVRSGLPFKSARPTSPTPAWRVPAACPRLGFDSLLLLHHLADSMKLVG
jgi:hypothetical protein